MISTMQMVMLDTNTHVSNCVKLNRNIQKYYLKLCLCQGILCDYFLLQIFLHLFTAFTFQNGNKQKS